MGFFSKIKESLKKTKDAVGKKLFAVFSGRKLDDEFYDDLQDALISADFGVVATDEIIEELKDRVYRKKVTDTDGAKKLLKQIMIESVDYEIPPYEYPLVILVAGVNGVGKTTAIGKLANKFKKQGKSVVVAAADTFRAAASEQLEIWAERADVRIIKHGEGSDPASVVYDAVASAKAKKPTSFWWIRQADCTTKRTLWKSSRKFTAWWRENFRKRISETISCLTLQPAKTPYSKRKFSEKSSTLTASF